MIYALPAIIGLIIKLCLLYFARSSKKSKAFITFITLVSIHNISELFLFYEIFNQANPTFALKVYYACLLGVVAGMCVYVTKNTQPRWANFVTKCTLILFPTLCCLTLFSSTIVNGFMPLGALVTASKGNFYFLFQFTSTTSIIYTFTLLIKSCFFADTTEIKIRSAYILASFAPALIIALVVLALMIFGIQVNAIALLPIGTTLLVFITLKAESNHSVTDIRMYLPFSKERRTSQDLIQIMSDYSVSEKEYKKTVNEIERVLLKYSYEKSKYCKSTTAKKLNVSRSTLYGMLNRLNIEK